MVQKDGQAGVRYKDLFNGSAAMSLTGTKWFQMTLWFLVEKYVIGLNTGTDVL